MSTLLAVAAQHAEARRKEEARQARAAAERARTRANAAEMAKTMQCNCNLDNWQPEWSTGHSWVCRIHKAALASKAPQS